MKVYCLLFFLMFSSTSFCQYNYEVLGELNLPGAKKVFLHIPKYDQPGFYAKDSAIVNKGKFTFRGAINLKCYNASIHVPTATASYIYQFVLDEGTNQMNLPLPKNKSKILRNISTVVSQSNLIKIELEQLTNKERDKFADTRSLAASGAIWYASVNFLKNYPDDYYTLLTLYHLGLQVTNSVKKDSIILKTYQSLNEKLKTSELGIKLRDEKMTKLNAYDRSSIGKKIFSFTLKKLDGNTFNNQELQGKPYLLVFSATWCIPCQQQIPTLKSIYQRYNKRGLEIVYINLDDNNKKWRAHVARNKLNWINLSELILWRNSNISKSFAVTSIPKTIMVDKSGLIIYNSDQAEEKHLENFVTKFYSKI